MTERAPNGLKSPGSRFWRETLAEHELRVDELRLLELACRTLDRIAAIEAAFDGEPMTVRGSAGQLREHPLVAESRQQHAGFARLVKQLNLDDSDERAAARADARSEQGRRAVAARRDR